MDAKGNKVNILAFELMQKISEVGVSEKIPPHVLLPHLASLLIAHLITDIVYTLHPDQDAVVGSVKDLINDIHRDAWGHATSYAESRSRTIN